MLCIQWLQRFTHIRGLRWIAKLIPFFDACHRSFQEQAPLLDRGMLITRCVLIVIYSASGTNSSTNGISICGFLINYSTIWSGHVYKTVYLTILECISLVNLCILATGTLYVKDIRGNQEALAGTSVIITSLLFIAVVVYHGMFNLNNIKCLWRKIKRNEEKYAHISEQYKSPATADGHPAVFQVVRL